MNGLSVLIGCVDAYHSAGAVILLKPALDGVKSQPSMMARTGMADICLGE
jgi:hypothetical protein